MTIAVDLGRKENKQTNKQMSDQLKLHVSILLCNCKQSITSLSLLVVTTVVLKSGVRLNQDHCQFSCHQIWCKLVTPFFTMKLRVFSRALAHCVVNRKFIGVRHVRPIVWLTDFIRSNFCLHKRPV